MRGNQRLTKGLINLRRVYRNCMFLSSGSSDFRFLSAVSPGLFLYQTLEADWEAWKGRLGVPVSKIRTTWVAYWVNVSVSSADRFVPLRRGSLDRTNLNQNQSIRFQNTVFTGFVTDGWTNERTGNPFIHSSVHFGLAYA